MKTSLFFLLFSSISFLTLAQNEQLILGHWVYDHLDGIEKMSTEKAELADKMFGSYSFEFDKNGRYKMVVMGLPDGGKWKLEQGGKMLVMTANDGSVTNLRFYSLTHKNLPLTWAGAP